MEIAILTKCHCGAAGLQQSTGVRGDGGGGLYVGSVSPGGHAVGEHGLVGRHRHRGVRYRHVEDERVIDIPVRHWKDRATHNSDFVHELIQWNTGRDVQTRPNAGDDDVNNRVINVRPQVGNRLPRKHNQTQDSTTNGHYESTVVHCQYLVERE